MRFLAVIATLTTVWMLTVVHAARLEQGASTWSGVYTDAQAKLGQDSYAKNCSECHGQDLGGDGFAPGLKGPEFMNNWNGLSVGELYDRIRVSMPPTNPNAVSAKEKADIVAYILKEDGFPAGDKELPATVEALKGIKFEATKPGR
jgi:S-disulfanyl-L-cysteine oxidoreductase SoxD